MEKEGYLLRIFPDDVLFILEDGTYTTGRLITETDDPTIEVDARHADATIKHILVRFQTKLKEMSDEKLPIP